MTAHRHTSALYTATEAAKILKVKKSWLERQAAAQKIPFTMLGGAYRFTDGHLAAIVQIYDRTIRSAQRTTAQGASLREVEREAG
jgi:excisionase family DNA binding protein